MSDGKITKENIITLKNRKEATVSGVESIIGFDEEYVAIETELGRLIIEGKNMKIESLIKEEGRVSVTGLITSFYYSEIKKRSSLWSRLFS